MKSDSLSSIRYLPSGQRRRSGSSKPYEKRKKSDTVSLGSQARSPQFNPFPIILDDPADLADTVPLAVGSDYLEGLLAKVDLGPGLLSPMSGYEKPPIPDINEYSTSEAHLSPADDPTASMYIPYKGPSFAEDQVLPVPTAYSRHAEGPLSYTTGSFYNASAAYEAAHSRFPVYESRKPPEITSYHPDRGPEGTQVFVFLQSSYDFNEASPLLLSLMFATTRCVSTLNLLEHRGLSYQYVLTANAPEFASIGWNSSRVPLRMQLQDESGLDVGWIDVGSFQYIDSADHSNPASPEETRKRKPSTESAELKRVPVKRLPNQQLQSSHVGTYTSSPYGLGQPLAFSQATQAATMDATYDYLVPYGRLQGHRDFRADSGSQPRPQSHSLSSAPQSLMTAPSPQTPSWGSSHALPNSSKKSPGLSATPAATSASRISTLSTPSNTATPHLVRTSTIQPPPGSPAKLTTGATGAPFSPYALYPPKAILQINGDLDAMADHWTPEEWAQKRRIVQFWRSQSGTTIHTNFAPVKPDERGPNSICISCILWEERRECFVTSVDTIHLLESLIANHFGVEEKNRIRRNLEGYRPMTVSKGKPESEKFFKVIMGFPTPKPRNIEKDVKVFPWKILATALKKIVGKYSATYSSTASSALPAPRGMSYAAGGPSAAGTDHTIPSARSRSGSTVSSSYAMGMISAAMSPISSHGQVSGPGKLSDPPGLPVAVPSLTHAYTVSSSMQGQYSPSQPISSPPSQPSGTSHGHRGSLDFPSFLETGTRVGQAGEERGSPYSQQSLYPAGSSSHDIR